MNPNDFRFQVIRPTLNRLGLWSAAAELLLLGTALAESGLRWLRQKGGGPALGVYQIEPATHRDIWANYLAYRPEQRARVAALRAAAPEPEVQLMTNLAYATAIARLVYRRRPEPMPAADDLAGLAGYWKAHYNTALGAGAPEDFMNALGPHLPGASANTDNP